ncbi:hypothetical protein MLC52_05270 [Sulfurimonas sp. NW15]|uniref:hypothetical protein n=1 Tax=Sulfurimonas sp. NW15 TaxID=2922729 RepID=UPI003DA8D188
MINENSIEVQLKELAKTQQLMMEKIETIEKKLEAKTPTANNEELVSMLKEMDKFLKQMDEWNGSNLTDAYEKTTDLINGNTEALISYHETTQKFVKQVYAKIEEESQKLNRSIGATQNTTKFS